jgi:ribosomal protein S26
MADPEVIVCEQCEREIPEDEDVLEVTIRAEMKDGSYEVVTQEVCETCARQAVADFQRVVDVR